MAKSGGIRKEKRQKRFLIEFIILVLAVTCIWLYWMNLKTGYSWDDLTSYGAANSNYSLWMPAQKGEMTLGDVVEEQLLGDSFSDFVGNLTHFFKQTISGGYQSSDLYQAYQQYRNQDEELYWMDKEDIYDYLTVQEGERLNLFSILECNWEDTHPPLYHIVLNAVCSAFPGEMSKWFGFTVNMLSLWVASVLVYMIMKSLGRTHGEALLAVAVYGVSNGAISTVVYLRMYAMLTAFVLALLYQHIRLSQKSYQLSRRDSVWLILNLAAGYLTQYYFCFAAAVLAGIAVCSMLKKGLKKECGAYVGRLLLAAVIGMCVWPFGIKHMFLTGRGSQAVGNFRNLDSFLMQLADFLKTIVKNVFANPIILIVAFIAAGYLVVVKKEKKYMDGGEQKIALRRIYIWPLVILYLLLATVASPVAGTRYISCIFPVIVIGVMDILESGVRKNRFLFAVSGLLIYFICSSIVEPEYVDRRSDKEEAVLREYKNNACIYIEEIYCYQRHLTELAEYERCMIVNWESREGLLNSKIELPGSAVLYVSSVVDDREVVDWILDHTSYTAAEILVPATEEYAGTAIYYLTGNGQVQVG